MPSWKVGVGTLRGRRDWQGLRGQLLPPELGARDGTHPPDVTSPLHSSCWFLFLLLGSARPARPGTRPGTRRSTRPPHIPRLRFPRLSVTRSLWSLWRSQVWPQCCAPRRSHTELHRLTPSRSGWMAPGPSVGLPLSSLRPSCLWHPQSHSTGPEVATASLAPGWDGCSVGTTP